MISYFEIKKNLFKIILISIIFIILLKQIDFFKKFYFTITRSYESRLINSYEYCGHESIGFLAEVKKKFNIKYNLPIINLRDLLDFKKLDKSINIDDVESIKNIRKRT